MAEERGWRALWRAGTGVWEGGSSAHGSEGRPRGAGGGSATLEGVEGGSATLEGGEEAAARLWRAGSWKHKVSSMQTLFHQHSWHSNRLYIELNNIVHLTWYRRGGDVRPAERESLGECGKEAGSRRQRDPGGRGEGGSAARTEARGRQRGSEGGPETAARLGGRRARRGQRGSEGGTEARRQRGSEDLGRHGGGSAARREARRRFGERECGEVEEAVQCSHSNSHSPFLK